MKEKSAFLLLAFFMLTACSRENPRPLEAVEAAAPVANESVLAPVDMPVAEAPEQTPPPGEPSEEVLRKLEFQRYEAIEAAGGLPVTVSATGRQLVLKPKLYSVRKEGCKPVPQAPVGWYECSLIISLSLAADGSDPSEQGERIGVKWDGRKEEWVLQ
ncbi:MAG: hypothetical protein ACRERR_13950 [Moraxellaceae bacterium]